MNPGIDDLAGIMLISNGKYERYDLFMDFCEMLAFRISNTCDPVHLEQRKKQMVKTMAKYTEAELIEFERYISMLTDILQRNLKRLNLEDVLGRLYERNFKLSREQELTPKCIATIMARIVCPPEKKMPEKGYFTVYDPTCGSGGSFLDTIQRYMELGYNPVTDTVVLANDINYRSVLMAYIQTSFYGIPALITQMDIFPMDEVSRWYTPAYILGNWLWRGPVNHTTGRNIVDEQLKMFADPLYAAIRKIWGWPKAPPDGEDD